MEKVSLKFNIASDLIAAREVQRKVMQAVDAGGFDENAQFGIKLALEEALVNAIKHGNKLDPTKRVRIQASIDDRRCEIIIEDEGPGFDRTCVPDPTAEENLTKCSGRGLLLIEAYMTSVKYSKGGRRVRLVKERQ